ncbi:MAG: SpoIID/LytB domain-containing protein [Candidatus Cloacimonetes bacterium]|nr:SpoIID/LytB domain-containing protein [Candidatus Cloacimonadota bacterium]
MFLLKVKYIRILCLLLSMFSLIEALEIVDDIVNIDVLIYQYQAGDDDITFSSVSGFYLKSEDKKLNNIKDESITISKVLTNSKVVIKNKVYSLPLEIISESPIRFKELEYSGFIKIKEAQNNKLVIINCIDLESYVAGVISAEIGASSPFEALKAQAIATRTITIKKILNNKHQKDGYDLCSTVHCQVYKGLKNQSSASYRSAIETSGLILVYNNQPIDAVYSSSCGGVSESTENLWGFKLDYSTVKTDSYCIDVEQLSGWQKKYLNWQKDFSVIQLQQMFAITNISAIRYNRVSEFKPGSNSDRIEKIEIIGNKIVTIEGQYKIRETFNLPSSLFIVYSEDNSLEELNRNSKIIFAGNGYGHGVGMCQTGAIVRAKSGQTYQEILHFYYPNTEINSEWLLNNITKEK